MSTEKLSDVEVHELVIQQIRATTREKWQERIDAAVAYVWRWRNCQRNDSSSVYGQIWSSWQ